MEKYRTAGEDTGYNVIWSMFFAYWITYATYTDSEYVIIIAVPRQQLLCERASVLRYTYIVCHVIFNVQSIQDKIDTQHIYLNDT